MNIIKRASIKQKLILMMMLLTIATLLVVGTVLIVIDLKTAKRTMTERLDTLSKIIADRSTAAITYDDQVAATQMLSALKLDASVLMACTYTVSQAVLANYSRSTTTDCPTKIQQNGIFFKDGRLHLFHSILLGSKTIGTLYILASLSEIRDRLLWFIVTVIIIISFASVGAFYLANKLQSYITKPLIKLRNVTEYISSHADYSQQLPQGTEDEIGVLYRSFSHMIEQIQYRDTQRKQVEKVLKVSLQELQGTRNYLTSIINSMPSVLIGIDVEKRVTHWNQRACEVTGVSVEQAINQPITTVFPFIQKQINKIERAMSEGAVQRQQRLAIQNGDDLHYYDIDIFPLHDDNKGAVIRVDDVTTQVAIDEMMVQSEKMMSVGGLAAGMAHEINNPLSAILQSVENISIGIDKERPNNIAAAQVLGIEVEQVLSYMEKRSMLRFLGMIKEAGERAGKIVSDMLTFSRRSESSWSATKLAELIDKTVDLAATDFSLKKQTDFRRLTVVKDYQSDLKLVRCVVTEIQQVLLNLLDNAAHALYKYGEKVGVKPQITLRTKDEGEMVRIELQDNGPGMKEEIRKHIFEPFFTTKPVGLGTGLGLSVSYFIVTSNHKGSLNVESTPGKGSKFIIRLPFAGADRSEMV